MAETITQYRLETFLRGRLGTDTNVGTHSTADDVAVIDGTVQPVRLPITDVGRTLKFKFVTSGQQIDHVPAVEHVFEGNSLRTLAPAGLRGTRDQPIGPGPTTGPDILIQWYRRSRLAPGMRPSSDIPLAEEQEIYDVEIYSGATLKRTIRGVKPGIKLASFFVPDRPNDYNQDTLVKHNIVTANGGSITGQTFQRIPQTNNSFEASLFVGGGAFACMGLTEFGGAWHGLAETLLSLMPFGATLTGVTTPYLVIHELLGGAAPTEFRVSVYEHGSRIFSASNDSGAGDYDPNFGWFDSFGGTGESLLRFRLALLGSQVLVQKADVSGAGYVTIAKSNVSTDGLFPMNGLAAASANALLEADARDSFITTYPDPGTIYSIAQQQEDFGSAQSSVKVRVYQLSGVIGRGNYAEATI